MAPSHRRHQAQFPDARFVASSPAPPPPWELISFLSSLNYSSALICQTSVAWFNTLSQERQNAGTSRETNGAGKEIRIRTPESSILSHGIGLGDTLMNTVSGYATESKISISYWTSLLWCIRPCLAGAVLVVGSRDSWVRKVEVVVVFMQQQQSCQH